MFLKPFNNSVESTHLYSVLGSFPAILPRKRGLKSKKSMRSHPKFLLKTWIFKLIRKSGKLSNSKEFMTVITPIPFSCVSERSNDLSKIRPYNESQSQTTSRNSVSRLFLSCFRWNECKIEYKWSGPLLAWKQIGCAPDPTKIRKNYSSRTATALKTYFEAFSSMEFWSFHCKINT